MNLRRLSYEKPKLVRDTEFIWDTKDKQKLHLYEMTNMHIIHCIQMLTKVILDLEKRKIRYGSESAVIEHQNNCENAILSFEHELEYRQQEDIIIK